jgi:hypothetical protein
VQSLGRGLVVLVAPGWVLRVDEVVDKTEELPVSQNDNRRRPDRPRSARRARPHRTPACLQVSPLLLGSEREDMNPGLRGRRW